MIYSSLTFLTQELNAFIRLKDPLNTAGGSQKLVILTSIVDQESKLHVSTDSIFLTLVNTEEETVGKSQLPYFRNPDETLQIENPEIKLNLYMLFSAYAPMDAAGAGGALSGYERSLKLLDEVILFFQYKNVFRSAEYLALQVAGIDKLVVDPVSLTFEQQNHLWASLGAKYLPSVLFKCRTLTFREKAVAAGPSLIQDIQTIKTGLS